MAQKIKHGSVISYQREKRNTSGGEYGVMETAVGVKPAMLWPGLNASFGVDVEEPFAEIHYAPAHGNNNARECVRNVRTGEDLPFHLETYPQQYMKFPLLEFITGSVTGLGDNQDSTSWIKELDGKFSVYTGVMFEDYKCEIPERGVVKETISGFAGHRAAIEGSSPAVSEATENTSRPIVWNDIREIRMGSSPDPTDTIKHCLSDISFGFTSEVEKKTHPESALSTKICGVRVVARKMFVSLKLAWVDQTFIDIVAGSTKQYLTIDIGSQQNQCVFKFGGLFWPKYIAKAEPKELVGDTITCITDQAFFMFNEGPMRSHGFNIVIADGTSSKTETLAANHSIGNLYTTGICFKFPQLATPAKTVKLELLTEDDNVIFCSSDLDASTPGNMLFPFSSGLMGITKYRVTTDANISGNKAFHIEIRGIKNV
jgi:hypothetical protein